MPANAIADAKTNLFMQCSWELPKWKSKLAHSPANVQPSYLAAERYSNGYYDTTAANAA
jgi:hypothetical protein